METIFRIRHGVIIMFQDEIELIDFQPQAERAETPFEPFETIENKLYQLNLAREALADSCLNGWGNEFLGCLYVTPCCFLIPINMLALFINSIVFADSRARNIKREVEILHGYFKDAPSFEAYSAYKKFVKQSASCSETAARQMKLELPNKKRAHYMLR